MYTLKSIAKRASSLGTAVAVLVAAIIPAIPAYADALNPLTERSLTLSSGSPGWSYTDGSGNSTYAPPNSGANGRQTGNTFAFRVSSTTSIKGMTFQYCTTSAGDCMGPGDNAIDTTGGAGLHTRETNAAAIAAGHKTSDLEVKTGTSGGAPAQVTTFSSKFDAATGQPSSAANVPNRNNTEGNFIVLHKVNLGDNWSESTGWSMDANVKQTIGGSAGTVGNDTSTGVANNIRLTNSTGITGIATGDYIKVIFFGTDTNYITNPGSNAFFVKLNTYDSATNTDFVPGNSHNIDGGVTVANVMNRSIEIQTKVLETMDFSVGTVDPNTLTSSGGASSQLHAANGNSTHGVCDPVVPGLTSGTTTPNVLQMGNATGEFSLETAHTYSTHSYWRLSSNSSAGATVYYAGVTLSNTVGDQIDAIHSGDGVAAAPTKGSEQFGLALDNGSDSTGGTHAVSYTQERTSGKVYENGADNDIAAIDTSGLTTDGVIANASWHAPKLQPLDPATNYGGGTGNINSDYATVNTTFAFDNNSNLIPTPMASEGSDVVDCVTGKVRYIANIAATTPAGIYTTKVNYIAAPQY
ncbi:MAG: hypothetical protein JWP85_2829 [Rhodoglobus sp.]|nr:hypothetical protein [Rhodoglobus sp.]